MILTLQFNLEVDEVESAQEEVQKWKRPSSAPLVLEVSPLLVLNVPVFHSAKAVRAVKVGAAVFAIVQQASQDCRASPLRSRITFHQISAFSASALLWIHLDTVIVIHVVT